VAKVETTKKLPSLKRVISITFSNWTSCRTGLMNVHKRGYDILVFNHLARVMF